MRHQLWKVILTSVFLFINTDVVNAATKELSVKASFSGILVKNLSSCTIYPGDEAIKVPIPDLTIQKENSETSRFPFSIRLENCGVDLVTPGKVNVYLKGNADSSGSLMLDTSSVAKGIVIGIENLKGAFLPINAAQPGVSLRLNATKIPINLQAYIKFGKNATAGAYRATLTYVLEYE